MNRTIFHVVVLLLLVACAWPGSVPAAAQEGSRARGPEILASSFRAEVERLSEACLSDVGTLDQWKAQREERRRQLFEMLSLSPLPARSELKPVITGKLEHELFTVEKLHFQSMPGLYVTANLYLPKGVEKPAPAILYVCGHALVKTNGISYGNKTAYQHHPAWFARNGYACLIIDTIQLGEIQGLHHGTYREGMWWWNARGYTPAGVEAWNCIRALDYLQSRGEVDGSRLGVTGRSGGGAYSWWVAALDERIKVAAPVAGMTDLQNHVVDGVVEGHCDCMFMVNTYRWDYPLVAALVAPRPLLICNSDKDSIFPLDGVVRVHSKAAKIYRLYGAANHLGLLITEGPHKDTQDLQLPVFRWFNRHLKGEDPLVEMAATPFFTPQQLKVFETLPEDQRTTTIHESFIPAAGQIAPPANATEWARQRDSWRKALDEQVFRGWPEEAPPLSRTRKAAEERDGLLLESWEFMSEAGLPLRIYLLKDARFQTTDRVQLRVLDKQGWTGWIARFKAAFPAALADEIESLPAGGETAGTLPIELGLNTIMAYVAPRGIGLTAWEDNERKQGQMRRRFMLLGQTLDGMRVWDIRRAIQALGSMNELRGLPVVIESKGWMAANALYAALYEPGIERLSLSDLPRSHREGPDYLNVLRFLDIPQAVAMAVEGIPVALRSSTPEAWSFPAAAAASLGWPTDRFRVRPAGRD